MWKRTHKPDVTQWMRQMLISFPPERITYVLKSKKHMFENIWGPFIEYVEHANISPEEDE